MPCDVDEAGTFLAEGRPYGLVSLHHLYDSETAEDLYRKWRPGGRSVGEFRDRPRLEASVRGGKLGVRVVGRRRSLVLRPVPQPRVE